MLRNYFRIAFRNFRNHKLFSAINVLGLAIGISASLVIYLIVQHEFSYEKNWAHRERIYRITSDIVFSDMEIHNSGVSVPTADAVRHEVTGIELLTHFITVYQDNIDIPGVGENKAAKFRREKKIIYADSTFFDFFPHQFIAGNATTALVSPFTTVLSESRAKAYFGNMAADKMLGRTIIISDTINLTVTGIVKDLAAISDLAEFKMYVSRGTIAETGLRRRWSWDSWNNINSASQVFVRLKPGTQPAQILPQLKSLRDKYRERENGQLDAEDDIVHALQPLSDIHFSVVYSGLGSRQAHRPTLMGLLAVALFLLLLGCINFINLSTAQASTRAKEIGIRKTLGSGKGELIRQFLAETFILTLLATALSVALTPWLLHIFANFIPPAITFASLNQFHVWLFLLGLIVVVTFLAGIYPAWILTRFRPVTALKNQMQNATGQSRKAWLRKSLTVTQFVIAQFLIIATLVVGKQIHYSLSKDLGYSREAIVSFYTPYNYFSAQKDTRKYALMQELRSMPGIRMLSLAGDAPATNNTNTSTFTYIDGEQKIETMVEVKSADTNYFELFGMKLIAGRNLHHSDTSKEFVINETYARALGFKDPAEAVGKMVDRNGLKPIVGVLADFHTKSTHAAIEPLAYSAEQDDATEFHLALQAGTGIQNWKQTLANVEAAFKKLYPEEDFTASFFDENIASFYKSEKNISRLLMWATGLCIFISSLGLLGLVIFVTNSRTKEIGVRKVLGASVTQLVSLLSRDFLLLVLTAFVIAIPVAWWAMNEWLQNFVYRTSISWWIFAATGAGMLLISVMVLGARTIQSALANPVKSLRTE